MLAVNECPSQSQKYCVSGLQRSVRRVHVHASPQPAGPAQTSPRPQSRLVRHSPGPSGGRGGRGGVAVAVAVVVVGLVAVVVGLVVVVVVVLVVGALVLVVVVVLVIVVGSVLAITSSHTKARA